MAVYNSSVNTITPSTTNNQMRDVSDKVRELYAQDAPILALVEKTDPTTGQPGGGAGIIKKRAVKGMKYEYFSYTPLAVSFDVASGSGLSPVLADVTGLLPGMTIMNIETREVGIIDAINSGTKTLTVVAISSSFTSAVGNHLLTMAPAYKEGSTNPEVLAKDEDNLYNYLQPVRFAVEIAISAKGNPNYTGDYFAKLKNRRFIEGKQALEYTMLFGERSSSGDTTSTANRGSVYTTRGAEKWALAAYDSGGAMSPEKMYTDMILAMGDFVGDNDSLIMVGGKHIFGDIMGWYNGKVQIPQGKYEKLGVKCSKFDTLGPELTYIKHRAYSLAGNQNRALIFNPDDYEYVYKEGLDIKPALDIQPNDSHTKKDEIYGYVGFADKSGGRTSMVVYNWGARGAI